jgi:site-specific DNA-cytosine methylase
LKAIDVMGFAGSMAAGVDQAGFDIVAKREPAAFRGFGVASHTYNMPWVEAQVAAPEDWALPAEQVELLYGCPPCSGFSALSAVNVKVYEHTGTTYRGEGAEINSCMRDLIDFASDVRPRVVVMESVAPAFKIGRGWMESLWERLRERSGLPYSLTHVNMNASLVGGDVIRPRYFFVAHLDPFGVGLDFAEPRSFAEVVGDLGADDPSDTDWGQMTRGTKSTQRITQTIEWLESQGLEWKPGTRLPDNTDGLEPPDFWLKPKPSKNKRGYREDVYSHWYSTDPFSPARWRADKPFGVIVAASLDRAIHPTEPRPLTFREAARFMSLPDTWSVRVLAEQNRPDELGKGVPAASAKWIAHWAKMSIEGTPGEYAGRATNVGGVRVIQVQTRKEVDAILDHPTAADGFYPEGSYSDPDPAGWIIDRKARPGDWWQRDDELGIFAPEQEPAARAKVAPGAPRTSQSRELRAAGGPIARVPAAEVAALLSEIGMTKGRAAEILGVSVSRVNELVTGSRPGSLLNAARWGEVQQSLRGAA